MYIHVHVHDMYICTTHDDYAHDIVCSLAGVVVFNLLAFPLVLAWIRVAKICNQYGCNAGAKKN